MKESLIIPLLEITLDLLLLYKIFSLYGDYILYYFNDLKIYYILRTLSTQSRNKKFPEPLNNEVEDEDVKAERLKVKELMSCQCCEEVI